MLTALVLRNTIASGVLVLGMPLAFASLLTLRYPDRTIEKARVAETPASAAPSLQVAPRKVESLAAHRERKRASISPACQAA